MPKRGHLFTKEFCRRRFYGTTTVGEKGQVVVPAEAREALALRKGEKLLVFGMGSDMVIFSKVSHMEKLISHLTTRLGELRTMLKKSHG